MPLGLCGFAAFVFGVSGFTFLGKCSGPSLARSLGLALLGSLRSPLEYLASLSSESAQVLRRRARSGSLWSAAGVSVLLAPLPLGVRGFAEAAPLGLPCGSLLSARSFHASLPVGSTLISPCRVLGSSWFAVGVAA